MAGLLAKDYAENVMIVDLVRNDLARVCRPGTVRVDRLCALEEHPGLVHLVSDVTGDLRAGVGWPEILDATFPPGSVSGAPKHTALQAIADLEPAPRGPYCGAVGWVDADTDRAVLAVGIRTFWAERDPGRRRPAAQVRDRRRHHLGLGPRERVARERAQGRPADDPGGHRRHRPSLTGVSTRRSLSGFADEVDPGDQPVLQGARAGAR